MCTLKYLHNPRTYYAETPSDIFPSPENDTIAKVITVINDRYFSVSQIQDFDGNEDRSLIDHQQQRQRPNEAIQETTISFKDELQQKIDETVLATSCTSTANLTCREELETSILMQMALFDRGGPRHINLSQAYDFLLCTLPTSVECERVFSSSKYICNHLRCALNDESMDALSFLRSYFQGKR